MKRQILTSQRPLRGLRARSGFTLIELLVVVAIIAVLISILLPAIAMARAKAKTIQCAAQMRGLGQGYVRYSFDNNGALMIYQTQKAGNSWGWDPPDNNKPWGVLMGPYVNVKYKVTKSGTRDWYYVNPIQDTLILNCPCIRVPIGSSDPFFQAYGTPYYFSYGMIRFGLGGETYNGNLSYRKTESQIAEPSRQVVFADTWWENLSNNSDEKGTGWYYFTFPAEETPPLTGCISFNRHLGLTNTIFVDGHSEPKTLLDLRLPFQTCLMSPPLGIAK